MTIRSFNKAFSKVVIPYGFAVNRSNQIRGYLDNNRHKPCCPITAVAYYKGFGYYSLKNYTEAASRLDLIPDLVDKIVDAADCEVCISPSRRRALIRTIELELNKSFESTMSK